MDSREHELARFRKKASHYREALKSAPDSRVLELYPFVWHLERYCEFSGLSREKVRIVDLMAGSGFLANQLYRMGYRSVEAIESCSEMAEDVAGSSPFPLHFVRNGNLVIEKIRDIRPHVIVSLASFHHLISYADEACTRVDREASVMQQCNLIEKCLEALPRSGLMLIGDLAESDAAAGFDLFQKKRNLGGLREQLQKAGLPKSLSSLLPALGSVSDLSRSMADYFGLSKELNYSLLWFRDIVDKSTKIGHKDIALSSALLTRLEGRKISLQHYFCPWIFQSAEARGDFVLKKFGFTIDQPFTTAQVTQLINSRHFSATIPIFPWNLSLLTIDKGDIARRYNFERKIALTLSLVALVLLLAIAARVFNNVYLNLGPSDLFGFAVSFLFGMLVTELVNYSTDQSLN